MNAALQIIDRLSRLLHDEIVAISTGQLETVRDLYPTKVALMQELEAASTQIEHHLTGETEQAGKLREELEQLHVLIRRDHDLLERMTKATGRAAKELARLRDRHGLGGLYGAKGALRSDDVASPQQVDQSI